MPAIDDDRLRRALRLIGDEAAMPGPGPAASGTSWRRRRLPLVAAAVLAAACVAFLTLGLGGGSRPSADADGQGLTVPQWVACAQLIVVGEVTAVRDAPQEHRVVMTLSVEEWLKPASGAERVDIETVDPAWAKVREPLKVGQRLLVVDANDPEGDVDYFSGRELTDYRSQIRHELAKPSRSTCPDFWRTPTASPRGDT
ncbi:hypothetical protein [Streptomyces melanosporofaciens]|uniref:Uncharacterized protein n=1 Tax=Streptomyces melanosporofaciens TaxID=67327 RepID=A0A1H4VSQ6_STRMJ|nr:hypothetical protein [Streptomyces melanosporofaciens]SEC83558.1 hypothetical protein SAMN04490356_5722 [Streptomyces melanosporofaciens]